jgi:hypothetical protein
LFFQKKTVTRVAVLDDGRAPDESRGRTLPCSTHRRATRSSPPLLHHRRRAARSRPPPAPPTRSRIYVAGHDRCRSPRRRSSAAEIEDEGAGLEPRSRHIEIEDKAGERGASVASRSKSDWDELCHGRTGVRCWGAGGPDRRARFWARPRTSISGRRSRPRSPPKPAQHHEHHCDSRWAAGAQQVEARGTASWKATRSEGRRQAQVQAQSKVWLALRRHAGCCEAAVAWVS